MQVKKPSIAEIHPGIFQIFGRSRSAHAYVIKGRHKNLLIDSCLPDGIERLEASLSEIGLGIPDIHLVALTHEHIDHTGGLPAFSRTAIIAAHRLAANKLVLKDEFALMTKAFDLDATDMHIDFLLNDGTVIDLGNYEFHVLHTPGHSSGSVCFYEPNHRLLFSGDTLMANGIVGGVLQSGNVSDYIHSLQRLACLKVDHLYPGHGPLSDDMEGDASRGIERLESLLRDSKELFRVMQHSQHGFDQVLRSLRDLNESDH